MRLKGLLLGATTVALCVLVGAASGLADEPEPTPTPVKDSKKLGDVAKDVELNTKGTKKGDDGKIVISNESLPSYANKGNITTAKPSTGGSGGEWRPGTGAEPESKRDFWRKEYARQLDVIASLEKEIEALDRAIPKLWSDFYAWDDPAYRDGVIKPKLDEALVRREKLEKELEAEKLKPAEIKREARKDGAQPGWFRDL